MMDGLLELFSKPETWISLATLSLMEIVLGIDNIIFISITTGRLPVHQQPRARNIGIMLALLIRIALLFAITWLANSTTPLFTFRGFHLSVRDLIMLGGGLFLVFKSTREIHEKLEGDEPGQHQKVVASFMNIVMQVIVIDIVFSFDSIITAVGLVSEVSIMVIAVIISMIVMLIFSQRISTFIHKHPTMKMLALAFLLVIGVLLIAEAFHYEVPKGYVYFAMAFSLLVELLNMRLRKKVTPASEVKDKETTVIK
jgi:predicted tellurium resistance membrane protein TerC